MYDEENARLENAKTIVGHSANRIAGATTSRTRERDRGAIPDVARRRPEVALVSARLRGA